LSKATVHSYVPAINSFLTWAKEEGERVEARARLPKMRRQVLDVLSREEIQAMEDAAGNERDKLIVRILGDTGMRLGELRGLTISDLRQDGRETSVRVRGKGDKERLVPMQPQLHRRLRRYAERTRPNATTERIFVSLRRSKETGQYEALTESGVQQVIGNLADLAGITKRVYPHLLRHSFATHFLRRGGNPLLLQQILGHESLAMITNTYSHLTMSDAHAEAMRILLED
jgi:site-specific recombinase XerD